MLRQHRPGARNDLSLCVTLRTAKPFATLVSSAACKKCSAHNRITPPARASVAPAPTRQRTRKPLQQHLDDAEIRPALTGWDLEELDQPQASTQGQQEARYKQPAERGQQGAGDSSSASNCRSCGSFTKSGVPWQTLVGRSWSPSAFGSPSGLRSREAPAPHIMLPPVPWPVPRSPRPVGKGVIAMPPVQLLEENVEGEDEGRTQKGASSMQRASDVAAAEPAQKELENSSARSSSGGRPSSTAAGTAVAEPPRAPAAQASPQQPQTPLPQQAQASAAQASPPQQTPSLTQPEPQLTPQPQAASADQLLADLESLLQQQVDSEHAKVRVVHALLHFTQHVRAYSSGSSGSGGEQQARAGTAVAAVNDGGGMVDPALFVEAEDDIVGTGGCAQVYRWDVPPQRYAVKVDHIPWGPMDSGVEEEDHQRCADLLPALLPPHPRMLAPLAWWTAPAPPAGAEDTDAPAAGGGVAASAAGAAALGTSLSSSAAAAAVSAAPAAARAARRRRLPPGFKLLSVWERKSCDLRALMKQRGGQKAQTEGGAGAGITAGSNSGGVAGAAAAGAVIAAGRLSVGSGLDEASILVIVRDVASALAFLAEQGVGHCDIKPCNVLLDMSPDGTRVLRAHVADFGLAALFPKGADSVEARGGSWCYRAPEQTPSPMNRNPKVHRNTDAWSLGAMVCALVHGDIASRTHSGFPFHIKDQNDIAKWGDRPNGKGSYETFYMRYSESLPPEVHEDAIAAESSSSSTGVSAPGSVSVATMRLLREIALGCMHKEPAQRMAMRQVHELATAALQRLQGAEEQARQ